MYAISFENKAFNKGYGGVEIDMIFAPKAKYDDAMQFLEAAIKRTDEDIYPGCSELRDFEGLTLREGNYNAIVEEYISSMNESIEMIFDDIHNIRRIVLKNYDPLRDDFLIETEDEYIMFSWWITE